MRRTAPPRLPLDPADELRRLDSAPWPAGLPVAAGLRPELSRIYARHYIRLDADVLAWFKATGKGYQTRINNVLRAFVESRKRAER